VLGRPVPTPRVRVRRTVPRVPERVKRIRASFRSARHRLRAVSVIESRDRLAVVRSAAAVALLLAAVAALVGCDAAAPSTTPPIVPGDASAPREVNIITKDYAFLPDALDLVPGEAVLLHVINGGLEVHEAVIGDASVQDAWEVAEAATAGAPPGPTPIVTVPAGVAGLRIVVHSGERVDVAWTVPADGPTAPSPWVVGCHIPGHWARGMQIPVRWAMPTPAP
jgi:hypothetical protein